MDFFEAQARAKQRTTRLVWLFALAVLGTIVAMYFAAWLGLRHTRQYRLDPHERAIYAVEETLEPYRYWQPKLFGGVALVTVAIVGFGSLYKWSQFSAGGSAVAESMNGRQVDPATRDLKERRLLNVVEEMAIASGVAVPAVYVLDDEPGINAFAAGLTTNDAVVAVTRGTLEKLTRDELQGVIGHEFSHILNGDMRLNLRVAAIIFGILVLGLVGRGIMWSMRHARVSSRGGKNSGGIVVVILVVGLAMLVIGYIGYFFGRLIQAAVSRQREFLADASAVQFTRNPGGIGGALKKIGGYALGSNLVSNQSGALGHFFFAQAFRSGITGLWATHPPLDERIRAIEPSFDGRFFEPPEVVDVATESFVAAGLAPARAAVAAAPVGATPPRLTVEAPLQALGAIGTLTPAHLANAQLLLDATPPGLRDAAHGLESAVAVVYALLLDPAAENRSRQRGIVAEKDGPEAARELDQLEGALRELRDEQRLPLLQLALPALRNLAGPRLARFLETLDELVHADNRVSAFEYAMQRVLRHGLGVGREPGAAIIQYYSFNALTEEISVLLSVLARASTRDASVAPRAFAAGAAQLKQIEARLQYLDEPSSRLAAFDAALDKLAHASPPIKQRTLMAAAHVVKADGQVLVCEFELLRAVATALDVPMPPLAA